MDSSLYEKTTNIFFVRTLQMAENPNFVRSSDFVLFHFHGNPRGKRRVNGKDKRKEAILKPSDNVNAFIRLRHGRKDYLSAGRAR